MAYLIEILLLVVFVALWAFFRHDLAMLAKQARPPADDELGKVRANIEQLLDVLEEKSASADRNLRQLIEEARQAARQIEEATAMAVKSLDVASPAAEALPHSNGSAKRQEEPALSAVSAVDLPATLESSKPPAPDTPAEQPTPPGLNPLPCDVPAPDLGAVAEIEPLAQAALPEAKVTIEPPRAGLPEDMPPIDHVFTPWPAPAAEQPETLQPAAAFAPIDESQPAAAAGTAEEPQPEAAAGKSAEKDMALDFTPFAITPQSLPNPVGDTTGPTDTARRIVSIQAAPSALNGGSEEASGRTAVMADSAPSDVTPPSHVNTIAGTEAIFLPASAPSSDRFSEIYSLAQQGVNDVSEIARRTGLGQTEVEMVLSLWRRQ